ncbi:MAG: hypothetical protein ACFBSD_11090 [Paracoccaceae bacterium]
MRDGIGHGIRHERGHGRERAIRDRGVALFAAVWLALVVSVLALGVTRESRLAVRVAANEVAAARAGALAEGAILRLASGLAAEARGTPLPAVAGERAGSRPLTGAERIGRDGRAYTLRLGEAEITLRVAAEDGKLDENAADADVLAPVLARMGAGDAAIAAILAARDRDGRSRGVSWRLDHREIETVADLLKVPGIDRALFDRIAPHLTVLSGRSAPDPLTATPEVFAALPLSEDERARFTALRSGPLLDWQVPERAAFTLSATAELPGGTRAVRAMEVEISASEARPVRIIRRLPAAHFR